MGKWVSLPCEYYFHPINTNNIFKIHHEESAIVLPCFRQSTEISLWSTNFALLGYVKFYLILYIVNEWFLTRKQEQTSSQNNALTGSRIRQKFLELSSNIWCWQNFFKYITTCLYGIGLFWQHMASETKTYNWWRYKEEETLELSTLSGTSISQGLLVRYNCRRWVERWSEPEAIDCCYKK